MVAAILPEFDMNSLPPWANEPFELMVHAETHLQMGDDFDRRISLISFDNAIEVAIATYLALHPVQRGGRTYAVNDVKKWTENYHTKLEFFGTELVRRNLSWVVEKPYIIWVHDQRNVQYHGSRKGTPGIDVLTIARDAALWIFSVLFDTQDTETALEKAVRDKAPDPPPNREKHFDIVIDELYGEFDIGDYSYSASDILFATDYSAYRDLCVKLKDDANSENHDEVGS